MTVNMVIKKFVEFSKVRSSQLINMINYKRNINIFTTCLDCYESFPMTISTTLSLVSSDNICQASNTIHQTDKKKWSKGTQRPAKTSRQSEDKKSYHGELNRLHKNAILLGRFQIPNFASQNPSILFCEKNQSWNKAAMMRHILFLFPKLSYLLLGQK